MKQVNTEDTMLFFDYDEGEEIVRVDPDFADSYRIEREEYEIAEFMGREIVYQQRKVSGNPKGIVPGYFIQGEHYPQDSESFDVNTDEKAIEVAPVAHEDEDDLEKWLHSLGVEGRIDFW